MIGIIIAIALLLKYKTMQSIIGHRSIHLSHGVTFFGPALNFHYCKSGNFCENFIFANSVKRDTCDQKISQLVVIYLYQ